MSPFEAIQYVTGRLTLVAFLAVLVAWIAKSWMHRQENLIKSAQPEERGRLVEMALEGFRVDTSDLSESHKFQLLMARMEHRAVRLTKALRTTVLMAVVAAVAAVALVLVPKVIGLAASRLASGRDPMPLRSFSKP